MMRIEQLYRYPVKGLSAEALDQTIVEPGGAIPWDRAFALAHGDAPFDPAHPAFLPKSNFMCLLRHGSIARLRTRFVPEPSSLEISAPGGQGVSADPLTVAGRRSIGAWLTAYLGPEARHSEAGEAPVFHHVPGHVFGDQRLPVLSLINQASLDALAHDTGATQDPRRYRANIYFTGAPAWAEFGWVGRRVRVGQAVLHVTKRTVRCAATEVNPDTGARDKSPIRELMAQYGHADLGIHAAVLERGRIARGDAIAVLE